LCTPPLVTTGVFENDVNESTGNEMKPMGIKFEIEFGDTQNEDGVHDTDNNRFHENGRNWSSHLIYTSKKNIDTQ